VILFFDDITKVIKRSKCLLYADDLKIYKKVKTVLDCSAVQRDLDEITLWFRSNGLAVSINKCNSISFHRNLHPIHFNYKIGDENLERVFQIRDLGVILDTKLDFKAHIEYVTSKAYAMLGFIKRICHEFRSVKALKSIYCAHVRSHLEYACTVWQPHCVTKIAEIESIQKKFVMYALRRTVRRDSNFRLPPYDSRCKTIGIESLARRRINLSVFFIYDVLTNRIDAPHLSSHVIVHQSNRVFREYEFLSINTHRTDYGMYEPLNNMCMVFNYFAYLFDRSTSRNVFRNNVRATVLAENISFVRYRI